LITIIDYDIGNISAVSNMFHRLGYPCKITSEIKDVEQAQKIILPGNGSFDACVRNLRVSGLIPVLEKKVLDEGVPLLGICVGAQMLGLDSEEGVEPGLGWIDMHVRRFSDLPNLPVPHMGWNQVRLSAHDHPLTKGMEVEPRFYFVHSYFLDPTDKGDVFLSAEYGIEFAAGVSRGNIYGVQFHPEKSHRFGKQLLNAFAGI
jgi:imidazole glycerol-phosphate synthase subunit HisH